MNWDKNGVHNNLHNKQSVLICMKRNHTHTLTDTRIYIPMHDTSIQRTGEITEGSLLDRFVNVQWKFYLDSEIYHLVFLSEYFEHQRYTFCFVDIYFSMYIFWWCCSVLTECDSLSCILVGATTVTQNETN